MRKQSAVRPAAERREHGPDLKPLHPKIGRNHSVVAAYKSLVSIIQTYTAAATRLLGL